MLNIFPKNLLSFIFHKHDIVTSNVDLREKEQRRQEQDYRSKKSQRDFTLSRRLLLFSLKQKLFIIIAIGTETRG